MISVSLLDPTALTQEAVDSAIKKQMNNLKLLRLQHKSLSFFFFLLTVLANLRVGLLSGC